MQAWARFHPMTHFKFQTWPNTILPLEKFSLLWKTCAAVKYLLWVNKASHQWLKSASKSANFTDDVIISKRSCDWEGISQTRSNISGLYPWNFLNSVLLLIIRPLKSTTKFRQHLFAVTVIQLSWATEGRPLQVLLTVSTRRVTSVVARLFHEESTLTILKRGEVDKTLPGVMNTKISKIPKTETFRGDVQIIILVITAWKDIVFGRSWQMYVISCSEAHSTRRLWHTRNIRKITALMGKTPVAAIVEETCFGPYHFGARGWVRDIRFNRTRWPSPMKLKMSSWWRENRLENETTHLEEAVVVAHLDPSLVSKRAVSLCDISS